MDNMLVPLELTVNEINRLLLIIAEKPLAQVHDLYAKIRMQGDAAAGKAMRKAMAPELPLPPELDPTRPAAEQQTGPVAILQGGDR